MICTQELFTFFSSRASRGPYMVEEEACGPALRSRLDHKPGPAGCLNTISTLPIELRIHIGGLLSLRSLAALASTCKHLRELPKLCVTSEEDFDKLMARDAHKESPKLWRTLVFQYLYGPQGKRPSAWQPTPSPMYASSPMDVADQHRCLEMACEYGHMGAVCCLLDMFGDSYTVQKLDVAVKKAGKNYQAEVRVFGCVAT